MLVYTNEGIRRFDKNPVESKQRPTWEFWCLLAGNITIDLDAPRPPITRHTPTLWAFPPTFGFGCHGRGSTERAVFDFTAVPVELESQLGPQAYYEEPLSDEDCARIRQLADLALETVVKPTQLVALRQNAILHELSLIALRSIDFQPLSGEAYAHRKTDQALAWFASRMNESPTIENAAKFVHVSVAHLRRLFHEARGESPKQAFDRLRKDKIEELLREPNLSIESISAQVGFSCAANLNHFVRKHFGYSPRGLRAMRELQKTQGKGTQEDYAPPTPLATGPNARNGAR